MHRITINMLKMVLLQMVPHTNGHHDTYNIHGRTGNMQIST